MEIGLKERLIGAVVLVVIAVIVIPFVLKGPAPDTTVTRPLPLPSAASTTPPAEYRMPLMAAAPQNNGSTALSPDAQSSAPSPQPQVAPAQSAASPAPQPAPVVNEAPPPAPTHVIKRHAPAAPAHVSGKWTVQAGSFGSEANARKVQRALESRGYHAYISRYRNGGREFYRVRVGAYAERAAAERAAREIARAYGGKASAVPSS